MDAAEKSPTAYRRVWDRKPVLRCIYDDIYGRMMEAVVPGAILEIGGGSGNFKAFSPSAVSTDVLPAPWLDLVCDAQRLPFTANSFANIVMVDVLHHVESPLRFLQEAERVLRPGGRLIFCEPAITPLSGPFYRRFHDEPVDMTVDPLAHDAISHNKNPYDSNQAIPTLLVGRYRDACRRAIPGLALERVERFSFIAYPLSGGFRSWSMLPARLAPPLLAAEWAIRQWLGPLAAFRMLAVYRRVG